jgi:DNA-binding transcriptional ArsR family regulator
LDRIFGALSNETRRQIVARLARSPASVGELASPLAMSLPSVMQHLQVLQDCGLVTTRKVGRIRTCSVEPEALRSAEAWLTGQRTVWERRLDRLGDLLGEPMHDDERSPSSGGN